MKKIYALPLAIALLASVIAESAKAQCYAAYPNGGETQPAVGAWLAAAPPVTPWGNSAPPTAAGIGNINCGYSGILTVPICASNYITMYLCVGNIYTFSLCSGASWDSFITLTTTAGIAVTPATFDNDGCGTPGGLSVVTFVPTIPGNYRLRIRTNPCTVNAANCGTLQIQQSPVPTPPVNNDPCGALSLNPVTTTCNMLSTTAAWATQSNPPVAPACGAFSGIDVWYTATVPASGNLSIQTTHVSATNLAMAAYSAPACGGPFTLLPAGCNADLANPTLLNPFLTFSGLAGGSTVYIRVWPEGNYTTNGTFEICAYEPIPPPNDNPCGAALLLVGSPCTSTTFTTESATPLAGSMTINPVPAICTPIVAGDVWFQFVVPASGSVTISGSPGSLNNMAMVLYRLTAGTPCAGTLTQILCDDNAGPGNMPEISAGGLTPGETLYVRMWNQTTSFGTAGICVIPNTPPTNDNPCAALAVSGTPLTVNPGCLFSGFSTQYATITPVSNPAAGWTSAPAPLCGAPANSDIWFTAVVPTGGTIQFDTDDGSLSDAAMAVYTFTGSCVGGNLALTQVGCTVNGSANGPNMPALSVTGLTAGQTVYIRLWRQTGVDGTFQLCARTTNSPSGACDYVLRMTDSGGDGWNGSTVQVCIDPAGAPPPVCTNYTIIGSVGNITVSANTGDVITLNYTAVGGFQNQIQYQFSTPAGGLLYGSGTPPPTGIVFGVIVDAACNVPPAPPSDCLGAFVVCNSQLFNGNPSNSGATADLNAGNDGCLNGENQGLWFRFTALTSGTLAFAIQPTTAAYTDYDWAVWGPPASGSCPPSAAPLRCSWAAAGGGNNTGTDFASIDLTEGAGGNGWIRYIDAIAGTDYILYIDNFSQNGISFDFVWNAANTATIDCILPVELLSLGAEAKPRQVDLRWSTASEQNSAYFQVERSADGTHFESLGRVQAAGSSQSIREYTYVDAAPVKGVNYYRLQQVDIDGKLDYSNTVSATYTWSNVALNVYPNPAGESLWAAFEMPAEGAVRWRIMDMSGRLVAEAPAVVASGMNQVEIPLARVEAGSYMLELIDGAGVSLSNARFVKQ